jgi:hypothetical protein
MSDACRGAHAGVMRMGGESKLKVEDEGIVVIFRKKLPENDMDDINGFSFATQWHIEDKWFCDGGSGIDEVCKAYK